MKVKKHTLLRCRLPQLCDIYYFLYVFNRKIEQQIHAAISALLLDICYYSWTLFIRWQTQIKLINEPTQMHEIEYQAKHYKSQTDQKSCTSDVWNGWHVLCYGCNRHRIEKSVYVGGRLYVLPTNLHQLNYRALQSQYAVYDTIHSIYPVQFFDPLLFCYTHNGFHSPIFVR